MDGDYCRWHLLTPAHSEGKFPSDYCVHGDLDRFLNRLDEHFLMSGISNERRQNFLNKELNKKYQSQSIFHGIELNENLNALALSLQNGWIPAAMWILRNGGQLDPHGALKLHQMIVSIKEHASKLENRRLLDFYIEKLQQVRYIFDQSKKAYDVNSSILESIEKAFEDTLPPLLEKQKCIAEKPVHELEPHELDAEVYRILSAGMVEASEGQRLNAILERMSIHTINCWELWKFESLPLWLIKVQYLDGFKVLMKKPGLSFWPLLHREYGDSRSDEEVLIANVQNMNLVKDILLYRNDNKYFIKTWWRRHNFGNY